MNNAIVKIEYAKMVIYQHNTVMSVINTNIILIIFKDAFNYIALHSFVALFEPSFLFIMPCIVKGSSVVCISYCGNSLAT